MRCDRIRKWLQSLSLVDVENVRELHYITHIDNLISIVRHGIVCHSDARLYDHESVADAEVQARRAKKRISGGRHLHQYANLYINSRNPMLYRLCHQSPGREKLCVVRIDNRLLNDRDLGNVVVSDGNAASEYTRFYPCPSGLSQLKAELVFAEYWTDPDPIQQFRKKSAITAEILVPDRVDPKFVIGVYVSSEHVAQKLREETTLPIEVNRHLFFLGGR